MIWKPYAIGVAALAIAYGGYRVGAGLTEAKYLKAAEKRQSTLQARRVSAAHRIAKITGQGAQVRERITREVVQVPVYSSAECRLTPDGLRLLNEAITGQQPADSGLSASGAPGT